MKIMAFISRVLFLSVLLCTSISDTALSQNKIADSPCDSTYFNSLESRAWLEAQREITQNQNLIYKPDSVLAYTCFNQFGRVLANMQSYGSHGLFSESSRWGGSILDNRSGAMDSALQGLIASPLSSYLTANFNHKYMGGRSTIDPYKESSMSGGSYTCTQMNDVWKKAKCYDFQPKDREDQDGFYTFKHYADSTNDKRDKPTSCDNPNVWKIQMQHAGLINDSAPAWPFDKVETYFDRFDPQHCGTGEAKYKPIPTGLVVKTKDKKLPEYDEKVCIIPGCHYQPSSKTDGKCVKDSGN